jgi:hypothetical protein
MSSSLPSASNDYVAPADMRLDRASWDAALTSIGQRLRAAEAIRANFEALIALGTGQALQVISANVAPQLQTVSQTLAQLQADIAAAEDAIADLITGAVPMSSVTGLTAALAAKAATSYVDAGLAAKAASAHNQAIDTITGLQTALDAKAGATHDHTIGAVNGLQAVLDGKAPMSHNHDGVYVKPDVANTFTRHQGFGKVDLGIVGGAVSWDCSVAQTAQLLLSGNAILSAPVNFASGFTYVIEVVQDGTGGRTLSFNSAYKWSNGTPPVITSGAWKRTLLTFYCSTWGDMLGVGAPNY